MIFDSKIEINKMATAPRYDIVDSHLHFLDFTQDSAKKLCRENALAVLGKSQEEK